MAEQGLLLCCLQLCYVQQIIVFFNLYQLFLFVLFRAFLFLAFSGVTLILLQTSWGLQNIRLIILFYYFDLS